MMIDASMRMQSIRSLYSNSLNAVVLVVDRGLNYSSKVNKGAVLFLLTLWSFSNNVLEFIKACESSPEAHFGDIHTQLEHVKEKMIYPFQPGWTSRL